MVVQRVTFGCALGLLVACGTEDPQITGTGGTPATMAGGPAAAGVMAVSSGGAGPGVAGGAMGGTSTVTLAGSGQATGDGDQGKLFGVDMAVPVMPPMAMGGSGGGATLPPGEALSKIHGSVDGEANFKQTGADVTVTIKLTKCPDGDHAVTINDGFSCDSADLEGDPLPNGRGTIGTISCSGNKGNLTVTRKGDDKSKNWTVGDHELETDITIHVVIVGEAGNPSKKIACGNFFSS